MASGVEFDAKTSRAVEALYKTQDAARRRAAVIGALNPSPGERVLDIGTGPGFVAFEMAHLVAPGGSILGVDLSEPMLQLARARCSAHEHINFDLADATKLPVPDATVDAAVSVQVFEYVPNVDAALIELYRALRPGGRAAIVSTDWASIAWSGASEDLTRRVLETFAAHCPHQHLPRELSRKLTRAGLAINDRRCSAVQPHLRSEHHERDAHRDGLRVRVRARCDCAGSLRLAEELLKAGENGEYFFCLNQYLFCVSKPAVA